MEEDTTETQNVGVKENINTSDVQVKSEEMEDEKESDEKESDEKDSKDKGKGVKDGGRSTSVNNQHPPTNYRVKVSGLPRFYSFGVRHFILTLFSLILYFIILFTVLLLSKNMGNCGPKTPATFFIFFE